MDNLETKTPQASLHFVCKPPAKPWKKYVVPPPDKVYKVNSSNFRRVVQKLTGAPEFQPKRLQTVAPPPLEFVTSRTSADYSAAEPLKSFCSQDMVQTSVKNDLPLIAPTQELAPPMTPLELLSPFPPSMTSGGWGLFSPPPPSLTPIGLSSPSWFDLCSPLF